MEELLIKHHAASKINGVVGRMGKNAPIIPQPIKITPKEKIIMRRSWFLTAAIWVGASAASTHFNLLSDFYDPVFVF